MRKVEELAKAYQEGKNVKEAAQQQPASRLGNHDFDLLKKHLSAAFQTPVKFSCDRSGKGQITFSFASEEELTRLISMFDRGL